jgi:CubicO group peptidase (beta-lactamase class C family)
MTLHHLLTHTSGLTYGVFGNTPVDKAYMEARVLVPDLDGMVQKLAGLPLLFQPGERWHYSVSTDVLGKLIENVSGMTLDEFFETRIFRPLGMRDTGFYVQEAKVNRIATVYRPNDTRDGLEVSINARKNPFVSRRPKMLSGGGGLYSTATDYLRFCQMLLNGGELFGKRVLSPKTVALMTRNHVGDFNPLNRKGFGFGLGVAIHMDPAESGSLESVGTYYWGGIFNTTFFIDPEEQLIGIAMSQLSPNGHLDTARRFKLLVYQALIE